MCQPRPPGRAEPRGGSELGHVSSGELPERRGATSVVVCRLARDQLPLFDVARARVGRGRSPVGRFDQLRLRRGVADHDRARDGDRAGDLARVRGLDRRVFVGERSPTEQLGDERVTPRSLSRMNGAAGAVVVPSMRQALVIGLGLALFGCRMGETEPADVESVTHSTRAEPATERRDRREQGKPRWREPSIRAVPGPVALHSSPAPEPPPPAPPPAPPPLVDDRTVFPLPPPEEPPGSRIVFSIRIGKQADLYTIRPDGTDLQQLTDTPLVAEANPRWSPDRRLLAFDYCILGVTWADDVCGVDIIDVATGTSRWPGLDPAKLLPAHAVASPRCPGLANGPIGWSADGARVAFQAKFRWPSPPCDDDVSNCGESQIATMNLDGSEVRFLLYGPPAETPNGVLESHSAPAWTDRGVVALSNVTHSNALDWDGTFVWATGSIHIADDVWLGRLSVSPMPGRWWAYNANATIHITRPFQPDVGSDAPFVTTGWEAAWSPSGHRIAFVRDDGIYVKAIGEPGETRIFAAPERNAVWSLDW